MVVASPALLGRPLCGDLLGGGSRGASASVDMVTFLLVIAVFLISKLVTEFFLMFVPDYWERSRQVDPW